MADKMGSLVGLTGGYCAGKNYIGQLLSEMGFEVLDIDTLGHKALDNATEQVKERFGTDCIKNDGSVDRRKLGELVFNKPDELAALEAIVHPEANRLSEAWVKQRPGKKLVLNAALLHRSSLCSQLDYILVVKAPLWVRLIRAKMRDRLPFRQIFSRIRSQKEFLSQYSEKKADIHIVRNRGFCRILDPFNRRIARYRLRKILKREGMDS